MMMMMMTMMMTMMTMIDARCCFICAGLFLLHLQLSRLASHIICDPIHSIRATRASYILTHLSTRATNERSCKAWRRPEARPPPPPPPPRRPKYSVLRGLGVILREEGWRGFYLPRPPHQPAPRRPASPPSRPTAAYPPPPARARVVCRVSVCRVSLCADGGILFSGWCAMESRCRRSSAR